jgi:hypothetical protein
MQVVVDGDDGETFLGDKRAQQAVHGDAHRDIHAGHGLVQKTPAAAAISARASMTRCSSPPLRQLTGFSANIQVSVRF